MADNTFTLEDQMTPVYCKDCKAHTPRDITTQTGGRCDECNNTYIAQVQSAIASEKAKQDYLASLPKEIKTVYCPLCGKAAMYSILTAQEQQYLTCEHCKRPFSTRYVRIRSKKSKTEKKLNLQNYSIRVITPEGKEDLIEFPIIGQQDFEIRAQDSAIFAYKNGRPATIQNLTINRMMFIQPADVAADFRTLGKVLAIGCLLPVLFIGGCGLLMTGSKSTNTAKKPATETSVSVPSETTPVPEQTNDKAESISSSPLEITESSLQHSGSDKAVGGTVRNNTQNRQTAYINIQFIDAGGQMITDQTEAIDAISPASTRSFAVRAPDNTATFKASLTNPPTTVSQPNEPVSDGATYYSGRISYGRSSGSLFGSKRSHHKK